MINLLAQLQTPIDLETHSTSFLQDSVPSGSVIAIDTAPTYTIEKAMESPQTIVEEK